MQIDWDFRVLGLTRQLLTHVSYRRSASWMVEVARWDLVGCPERGVVGEHPRLRVMGKSVQ